MPADIVVGSRLQGQNTSYKPRDLTVGGQQVVMKQVSLVVVVVIVIVFFVFFSRKYVHKSHEMNDTSAHARLLIASWRCSAVSRFCCQKHDKFFVSFPDCEIQISCPEERGLARVS